MAVKSNNQGSYMFMIMQRIMLKVAIYNLFAILQFRNHKLYASSRGIKTYPVVGVTMMSTFLKASM